MALSSLYTVQQLWDYMGFMFRGATSPTDPNFLQPVNLTSEAIINSGSWLGCTVPVVFNGSTGYITLPPNMQSIVGVDINGWPQAVFGPYQQYAELGLGQIKANAAGCGPLWDEFDGHCTTSDIADYGVFGTLKVTLNNPADAGKTIRFYGKDQFGKDIYDSTGAIGISLTTGAGPVSTTQIFSQVDGINVEQAMLGYWHLDATILALDYRLGDYQPNDLRPNYHRYKTGTWDPSIPIACLCRLRHLPLYSATDFVIPGNLNAYKFGLQAVSAEANRNYDSARLSWAQCYNLLNQEHRTNRGKARYIASFNPHGPGQLPIFNSY